MLSESRHRQVNSNAPRILLISNESIAVSGSGEGGRFSESALEPRSTGPTHSRFAAALATRIRAPGSAFPVGISVPESPAISMTSDVLILIPARMAAVRLPGKPLLEIGGVPMIVRVMHRATEADVGPVVVATDSTQIAGTHA